MASEAGKGSKPRPYSVDIDTFSSNWDSIFGNKMKKDTKPIKLENPLNKDQWLCNDYNNVTMIDGEEYVTVYKEIAPARSFKMRKSVLKKVTSS